MVVSVDESGKDHIAVQIQLRRVTVAASKWLNAATADFEIDTLDARGSESYSCAR
jgi:hypothetical protein